MNNNEKALLTKRALKIPLYLHAYAYHLNMRYERILPSDLLDIASKKGLLGIKIHVEDGESQSLRSFDDKQFSDFKLKAKSLGLDVHIETSASDKDTLDEAIKIAINTGATSIRFYPRYSGKINTIIKQITRDIDYLRQYDDCGISFTIEQHEDLKSHEIVSIVKNSGMKNLSILFDFANMINANELPLEALSIMAPYITQAHIKDAKIIKEGTGYGHKGCQTGHGDIDIKELLKRLLSLGDDRPQVISFGLEEEVEYYAPAFRFSDEDENIWIPWRECSFTPIPEGNLLEERLKLELGYASHQLDYVRKTCTEF